MKKKKEDHESLEKSYTCHHPNCDKVFLDKNSFRKHLITHGEKQFICQAEGCGKKFLDNSKLKRHMLVHTGAKAYKCELCNKRFSLDFNLRTHLRIHTGEKPYVCSYDGCYKRFSQSSNLSAHERTHYLIKNEEENIKENLKEKENKKKRIFKVIRSKENKEEERKKRKMNVILDRDKLENNQNKEHNVCKIEYVKNDNSNEIKYNRDEEVDNKINKDYQLNNTKENIFKEKNQNIINNQNFCDTKSCQNYELKNLLNCLNYSMEYRNENNDNFEYQKDLSDVNNHKDSIEFSCHLNREFAYETFKNITQEIKFKQY